MPRQFLSLVVLLAAALACAVCAEAASSPILRSVAAAAPPGRFHVGLSNCPPVSSTDPSGVDALSSVAAAGISYCRCGMSDWASNTTASIDSEWQYLNELEERGLKGWLWLGTAANIRAEANAATSHRGRPSSPRRHHRAAAPSATESAALLTTLVQAFRNHSALLAYKGWDEPQWGKVDPAGLIRAYDLVHSMDPVHPLVLIQAPRGTVSELAAYEPAYDVTGCDIFPVAYPPGMHSDLPNKEISVVGDVTQRIRASTGTSGKPVWMTLQIAWSGMLPSVAKPHVPRFPSTLQERFMLYDAAIAGASGVSFFGGTLTSVMSSADAAAGFNWRFFDSVLRPLVAEVTSPEVQEALTAPVVDPEYAVTYTLNATTLRLSTRNTDRYLFVLAVCTGGDTARVRLSNLPLRNDGQPLTQGQVLGEWVQDPLPPGANTGSEVWEDLGIDENHPSLANSTQAPRFIAVDEGFSFDDWFGRFDTHVYRFDLSD